MLQVQLTQFYMGGTTCWLYHLHCIYYKGAGHSSGGRALSCEGFDPPERWINTAWWVYLQFGLFSIHQRLRYVLSCLWDSLYKIFLDAYQKKVGYVVTTGSP